MVPQDHTYGRTNYTGTAQGTPFQVADGDWGNSFSGDDSDTQLVRSHLTRRSKSVTDADLSELLPETRRPSFFSRRKQKAAPEQAAGSASLSGNRSFSGQLPSQVKSNAPSGSKPAESKSFRVKGENEVDTSKPKSGKWWSWGSSSKAPKSDSKVSSTSNSESISSNSRPTSLELPQQSQASITASAAEQAQLAHLSPAMTGCMSLCNTAPQQERPVSEVQWTDTGIGSEPPPTAPQSKQDGNLPPASDMQLLGGSSPTSHNSRRAPGGDHSRRVSWDDTILESAAGASGFDTGLQHEPNNRFNTSFAGPESASLDPTFNNQPANSSLASEPAHHYSPSTDHTPLDPSGAGHSPPSAASDLTAAFASSSAEQGEKRSSADGEKPKKGHRRGRSLTGLINLKTKPKWSQSQVLESEPVTPAASSSQVVRPKTPDAKAVSSSSSSLGQCFGMGRTLDEEAEKEQMPVGVVGLRNLGNTCFVNVALQCLRYTPTLEHAIISDILSYPSADPAVFQQRPSAAQPGRSPRSSHEQDLEPVPETAPLADGPIQISSPLSPSDAPGQTTPLAPDIAPNSNFNLEPAQHSMQSVGQQVPDAQVGQQQVPLAGSSQQQHSQPVGIPPAMHAAVSHSRSSSADQLQGSSPELTDHPDSLASSANQSSPSAHSMHISNSPAGHSTAGLNASHALPDGPTAEQQPATVDSAQQGVAAQAAPGDDSAQGPDSAASTIAKQPPPVAPQQIALRRGEIADSFKTLVKQVYDNSNQYAVDPAHFLRRIAQHPLGAEFCDGGQHDAQELFRLLLDSLHNDLNRIRTKPPYEEDKDLPGEAETDKADRLWKKYLSIDNSPITDLFGGQLQSTVHCQKCKGNFTTYEPFWDLSLPIVKEGKQGIGAWLSGKSIPTTIQDCLQAFTSDELLQGDESFKCEKCGEKTQATKRLRLYRLPKVLLLHIKRFKYSGSSREKLTNNVTFPIKGLKLNQFVSEVSSPSDSNATYDLYAVSNHYGSMAGGHYTAACRVNLPAGKEQWYNFNDDAVTKLAPQSVVTSCAYMLFYVRTE